MKIRIVYGLCSYGVALVLLFSPLFSAPEAVPAARIIPFVSGAFLLAGATLTNYELGIARLMRFRDTTILTIVGCLVVLLSLVFISYGSHLRLIALLASCLGVVSLLAYRTHSFNRHIV